jgi:hypothetical protein
VFSCDTPIVPLGISMQGIQLRANVEVDATAAEWPTLVQASVLPQVTLCGTGAIPFTVGLSPGVTVAPGKITASGRITDLSVGIDSRLSAQLTADLTVVFEAIPAASFNAAGQPVQPVPTMLTTVTLQGTLSFGFPELDSTLSANFGLGFEGVIPLPKALHQFLSITGMSGLPRQIGKLPDGSIPPGGQTPAPASVPADYDGMAITIDQGLQATHLPNGTVFSIERPPLTNPVARASLISSPLHEEYYADEEDSAIWTGHLLAAASYRYAATGTPESLSLVQALMTGIDLLFEVAGDAVVKGGVTSAVSTPGVTFARSVLPADSPIPWWQASAAIQNGRGYYEHPAGGWEVVISGRRLRFATYAEAIAQFPGSEPQPVGVVWLGVGSGGQEGDCTTDHPVSRDQYIGIFYGLYAAFQFVATPDVQTWAASHITNLLTYLLEKSWNLPLPPENAVCTSYLGAFDHQLVLLRIGATVNPAAFQATYERYAAASAVTWLPVWVTVLDPLDEGYYKFNLSHAAISPLLLAEDAAELRQNYQQAYNILRYATAHHRSAYFNLVRILIELPADRQAAMAIPSGSNPALPLSEEIQSTLAEYVRRFGSAAAGDGMPTGAIPDPAFQLTLWPGEAQLYTQVFELNRSYIAPYCMAVDQRNGSIMEFIWQNDPVTLLFDPSISPPLPETAVTLQTPQVQQCIHEVSDPFRECSGVDYLLPYWLAVYLGVLPKPG